MQAKHKVVPPPHPCPLPPPCPKPPAMLPRLELDPGSSLAKTNVGMFEWVPVVQDLESNHCSQFQSLPAPMDFDKNAS